MSEPSALVRRSWRRDGRWGRREIWRRERQIGSALLRHGVGVSLADTALEWLLPFQRGLLGHPRRDFSYTGPEHLRMAFEDLGPTFIKLAQILSTRGDLVGPTYASELAKLQSNVPPLPFVDIVAVLDRELGTAHGDVFDSIEIETMGSGSIGQVHRATLRSGLAVVVKIQKPGVRDLVELDLHILRSWIDRRSARRQSTPFDIAGFFDEFAFTLLNELDYTNEGDNADRFRHIHRMDERVLIPTIHWDFTTTRVLVMDEVHGAVFSDTQMVADLTPAERHRLAEVALHTAFVEIFREGFFHGDPHPGNFVVTDDVRLGLLDFGMVGTITERQREHFLEFVRSIGEKSSDGILDAWWAMGITEPESQRSALTRDLDHLFYRAGDKSFGELAAADMVGELMRIAFQHQLQLPPDLALLFKVVAMLESAAVLIDPDFLVFKALETETEPLLIDQLSPSRIGRRLARDTADLAKLIEGLPQRAERLLQRLETGDLELVTRDENLQRETMKLNTAIRTLSVVIAISAFAIGASLFVIAAETAGQVRPGRIDALRLLLTVGAALLATFVARTWWTRKR